MPCSLEVDDRKAVGMQTTNGYKVKSYKVNLYSPLMPYMRSDITRM